MNKRTIVAIPESINRIPKNLEKAFKTKMIKFPKELPIFSAPDFTFSRQSLNFQIS